jgi:cytochrome c biogenesis protein
VTTSPEKTAPEKAAVVTDTLDSLSTKPAPVTPPPGRRFRNLIRAWRWLTSMRTALVLLFLLALGVVPGSLLPQRALNPQKVDTYLAAHKTIGPLMDKVSLFNVFGAPWFAAIYILLFVSLIGCLVPRIRLHARALRAKPPKAPRHFHKLPQSTSYESDESADDLAGRAVAALRRGRWRVISREEESGTVTVSAEKGYLRETGNLLFHVSLTVLLLAVAAGRLWGYSGSIIVQDGQGFCNTVQQYDSFSPGQLVHGNSIAPFCTTLHKFTATYDSDGTASDFRGDISYTEGLSGPEKKYVLRSNHPLRIEGLRLYLLGHGFSPTFTVRDAGGHVFKNVSAPFLPQDAAFTSQGAIKLPDASPTQIGIDGLFVPTAAESQAGVLTSAWPDATDPEVAIFVYEGNLGLDTGQPQSVYSLDRDQVDNGALKQVGKKNLSVNQTYTLKDGTAITFTGYKQWANLQVSRDPSQRIVLIAAAGILIGLLLSMRIRRRRLWLRITPATNQPATPAVAKETPHRTVVEAGGLARTDTGVFGDEFRRITDRLRDPASGPDGED